ATAVAGPAARGGTTGGGGTTGVAGTGGRGGTGGTGGATGGTGGGQVMSWRGAIGVAADQVPVERQQQIAVDSAGNAVLVYQHGSDIWSNYYNATTSMWSGPNAIDMRAGSPAQEALAWCAKNAA